MTNREMMDDEEKYGVQTPSLSLEERASQRAAEIREQAKLMQEMRVMDLELPESCTKKLLGLGIKSVKQLLDRFPYNPQTNCLDGMTLVPEISTADYFEIWARLNALGALVRLPEPPDIREQRRREERDNILECARISEIGLSGRCVSNLASAGIDYTRDVLRILKCKPERFAKRDAPFIMESMCKLKNLPGIGTRTACDLLSAMQDLAIQQQSTD